MKRTLQEIIEAIANNRSQRNYFHFEKKPMPCELDKDFHELINLFVQAIPTQREIILSIIDSGTADALQAYSWRLAVWGARQNSRELLLEGLIGLVIDGGKADIRDTISVMPVLYHSAIKIGIEPQSLFDEAASYFHNDVARILSAFPRRPPENRNLQSFYYVEVSTPEGIDYKSG